MGEKASSSETVIATVHLYIAQILELDILCQASTVSNKVQLFSDRYISSLTTVHNTQHQSSSTSC